MFTVKLTLIKLILLCPQASHGSRPQSNLYVCKNFRAFTISAIINQPQQPEQVFWLNSFEKFPWASKWRGKQTFQPFVSLLLRKQTKEKAETTRSGSCCGGMSEEKTPPRLRTREAYEEGLCVLVVKGNVTDRRTNAPCCSWQRWAAYELYQQTKSHEAFALEQMRLVTSGALSQISQNRHNNWTTSAFFTFSLEGSCNTSDSRLIGVNGIEQ